MPARHVLQWCRCLPRLRIMIVPTIHRNGTAKQELIDQLCDAGGAISTAITALENACPNARDYYPQGQGAIQTAIEEHRKRIDALVQVRKELQQIAIHIDEGPA